MANRQDLVNRLCDSGIVAVVRASSSDRLNDVAAALLAGGVECIEITMTTPNALEVISQCRQTLGHSALIGVGKPAPTPAKPRPPRRVPRPLCPR